MSFNGSSDSHDGSYVCTDYHAFCLSGVDVVAGGILQILICYLGIFINRLLHTQG